MSVYHIIIIIIVLQIIRAEMFVTMTKSAFLTCHKYYCTCAMK